MKKHSTGFVPADFNAIGKVFIIIGIITLIFFGVNYFIDVMEPSVIVLYFGAVALILGYYLLRIVPKED